MKTKSNLTQIRALIKERISHNSSYLAQSKATRAAATSLSSPDGKRRSDEWLDGEKDAIEEEQKFLKYLVDKMT